MMRGWGVGLLVCLALAGGAAAQTLHGTWKTTMTVALVPVDLDLDAELTVNYSVGLWSFGSTTAVNETGWAQQRFAASGTLGDFTISSAIQFAPANPSAFFSSWSTTSSATLFGILAMSTFTVTPGNVDYVLDLSGSVGGLDLRGVSRFGDRTPGGICDFGWTGVTITADFAFCCADVMATLDFTCDGFSGVSFRVQDIALPTFPWVTLSVLLTFTTEEKALAVTPRFDFGVDVCFTVYTGIGAGSLSLFPDVSVDGLGIACAWNGVEFIGQSYWGTGSKPYLLSSTPYWEAYQIKAGGDACCGPLEFDVTAYFLEDGASLFDIAEIAGRVEVDFGPMAFEMGLEIELGPPLDTTLTFSFVVDW